MRILAINQFFWPDSAATGRLLTDLTELIDPKLHEVTVVCGPSDYGSIDAACPPRVQIVRLGNVGFSRGKLRRLVSYATFFLAAAIRGIREKPDIVLTLTTPPLICLLGTVLKRLRGSRHFIWEMDVYPDIAVDLNILGPGSFVTRLSGTFADFSRNKADGIIALGEDMKARLVARGISANKIRVADNWADGCEILPSPFEQGPLTIHYSGTFGLAHEEYTISEAMRQLRDDDAFRFVFAGAGARRKRLEEFCRIQDIRTVEFRPYVKRSELSASLAEGHIGLVTQVPETVGAIVPSKIYGIMAAGRPVLYIGPQDTTPARIIQQHHCGWQIQPGDAAALVRLLRQLEGDRDLLRNAGVRARESFEEFYDKPIGISRVLSILGISQVIAATNVAT
jgi:colanic acid biosynthesis glycosyl transferase WcaI